MDDQLLKELWPTRLPDRELAARLGACRGVVRRRAGKLGLGTSRRKIWEMQNSREWNLAAEAMRAQVLKELAFLSSAATYAVEHTTLTKFAERVKAMPLPQQNGD